MRSGLIMCKFQNQLIQPEFLKKAVELFPTAAGFALARNGVVLHDFFDPADTDLLDALQKTSEKFKGEQVYFHLAKADEGEFTYDSLQPFSIIQKGDSTLLAVMLEGDFPTYAKAGEDTPEYHMVQDYLKNKIQQVYKRTNSLEKTCEELSGPTVRADILPHLAPRGMILQIPAKGKAFAYADNKMAGEFAWGFATKTLGFEPLKVEAPKETPKVVEVARPLTLREKMLARKALAEAPVEAAPEVKEPEKKTEAVPAVVNPPGNSPFIKKGDELWCKPTGTGNTAPSWKETKKYWKRHTALSMPSTPQEAYAGFPASALKKDSPLYQFLHPGAPSEDSAIKDALQKALVQKEQRAKTSADEAPGLLTAEDKRIIVDLRKNKTFWEQTVEQLQEDVKPTLSFSEQTQVPFEDLLHASLKFGMRLEKRQLLLLWHETRLKLLQERSKATKTEAITTSEQKIVEPTKPLTLREKALARKAA